MQIRTSSDTYFEYLRVMYFEFDIFRNSRSEFDHALAAAASTEKIEKKLATLFD